MAGTGSNDLQLGWAIGLFEGEGCIAYSKAKNCWALIVVSTDHDVIARLAEILGYGTIQGPYQRGDHKPHWKWQAASAVEVVELLELFLPHLSERRAMRALEALDGSRARLNARQFCRRGLHPAVAGGCPACRLDRERERRDRKKVSA